MPRYNVNHNDKWACFSSICDGFITGFMTIEKYQRWRKKEYGFKAGPVAEANQMSFEDAIFSMCLNKTKVDVVKELEEIGLKEDEYLSIVEKSFSEIECEREVQDA